MTARDLAEGLRCLDRIEETFMVWKPRPRRWRSPESPHEQRVDILVQAALKGAPVPRPSGCRGAGDSLRTRAALTEGAPIPRRVSTRRGRRPAP